MEGKITVAVLTVSDRCANNEAVDESGPGLVEAIKEGVIGNAEVVKTSLVSDDRGKIQEVLNEWCDQGIQLVLTTGGTGVGKRDQTPEATALMLEKEIPGISYAIFKKSSESTPLAALSRGIAGVRNETLIINLPGSKKASRECLEAAAAVVPHAVDLICGDGRNVARVHSSLQYQSKSKVTGKSLAERPRKSPYPCLSVSEAQTIILSRVCILRRERVLPFEEALGYVVAQDVVAEDFLPPFDASLADGYAVLSADSSYEREVIGCSTAGGPSKCRSVANGVCIRVNTGASIPEGADAVVRVEQTKLLESTEDGSEEKKIRVNCFPLKGADIRPKGCDILPGNVILSTRTCLDSAAMGLLGAAGISSVRVFDKPVVGLLSTGNELVNPGEKPGPGQVRDSNRVMLKSLLKEEGFPSVDLGMVVDHPDSLCESLARGFRTADVVVTTGGVSMGDRDYLKEVLLTDFEAEICFGRVEMKPGKPTSFALLTFEGKWKLWFGLPGNPASAFVTTHLFLLPALRQITSREMVLPPSVTVRADRIKNKGDRPEYVRAIVRNDPKKGWFGTAVQNQSSSRIGSCVSANALILVPSFEYPTCTKPPEYKALLIHDKTPYF